IENIDACLTFLAAKGVNIQGLSAEGETSPPHPHPPLSQQSSAPAQLGQHPHGTSSPASQAQRATQAEMQSRLPGPTARVSTAGGDITPRGAVAAPGNRRSQGFTDKTKASLHMHKEAVEGPTGPQQPGMTEHITASLTAGATGIPQEKEGSSKAAAGSEAPPKEDEGNARPGATAAAATALPTSSPKIALRGIAQRTFSRALTAKKSLGGKVAKKESSAPAHSGIPKPGGKAPAGGGKTSAGGAKESGERPRSMRLGGGLGMHRGPLDRDRDRDSRHSSSTSSLASSEGKAPQAHGVAQVAAAGGGGATQSTACNTVSVQLPQTQSQTDGEEPMNAELGLGGYGGDVSLSKTSQPSIEDLSGEDPETRRLRTVKNIADLRQNLEDTMSSLRGTQVTHSTLETTFDGSVTTEAGDAPSLGNGFGGGRVAGGPVGRYLYPGHLRRQLAGRGGALELGDRAADDIDLEGIAMEVTGYMSDGDVLTKNVTRTDDVTSGYMTDGGLGLYTRRLNRLPDSMTAVRETLQRNTSTGQGDADSSSVSSGISDNIDTDDINTSSSISSYANTPAAQRKGQPVTDAEKRSVSGAVRQAWSGDEVKRSDGGSDSGVRMEHGSKWSRRHPSDMSDESDKGGSNHGTGKTDDIKVSEKGRLSPRSNGLHRSPSDAGCRSSGDEAKRHAAANATSSSSMRAPSSATLAHALSEAHGHTHALASRNPTSTFGFKKQGSGLVTMVTASGATITSGSATLGKMPKSGGSIEAAVLSVTSHGKAAAASAPKAPNQTDREKGVSEMDNPPRGGSGIASLPLTGRQQVSSPTLRRLFGGKPGKQAPVTTVDNMKNSTRWRGHRDLPPPVRRPSPGLRDGNPGQRVGLQPRLGVLVHGAQQQPDVGHHHERELLGPQPRGHPRGHGGPGSLGYPSVSSMHTSSESIDMSLGSAGVGGGHNTHREDTLSALGRTGSVKTSDSPIFSRNTLPRKQDRGPHCGTNTLPKKGLRYAPSAQLRSHEEARDWLRSHSTSGLQDSVGNSPFSPGSSITSPTGTRFNFSQLASSPTSAAQINLAGLRNNSLTNQDVSMDPCGDTRLRNSCMSLDEKTRTMSRSGSFRDGFEEVHGSSLSLIRKLRRELDASQEK
ncbi:hypothetical protein NHX12_005126, partial [Muraenolepis orangiensis]